MHRFLRLTQNEKYHRLGSIRYRRLNHVTSKPYLYFEERGSIYVLEVVGKRPDLVAGSRHEEEERTIRELCV